MIKIVCFLFFCSTIVSCSGAKTKQSALDSCSNLDAFTGVTLAQSQDVSALKDQVDIDLKKSFNETQIELLTNTYESILKDTNISDWAITLAIPGKGSWTKNHITNHTDIDSKDAIFWWMSVGKMFTSVVIHQLIDEGSLTLDTTLNRFFPEVKHSQLITINQLLTHTSGIYSFQEDPVFRAQDNYIDPKMLLQIAMSHEPLFCPGSSWHYSNTGYVILGLIIEQIEQKKYHQVIQERINNPLGLAKTGALQPEEFPKSLILDGNRTIPSTPFSAGNIVSNSEDMVIFLQSLLTGKLYSQPLLASAAVNPYRSFDAELYYGRGLISYFSADMHLNWIGHSGGSEHTNALVAYDFESGAYIAISVNDKTAASAIAFRFFKTAKTIMNQ